MYFYINKSHGFGTFKKEFLVVNLGQWWSVCSLHRATKGWGVTRYLMCLVKQWNTVKYDQMIKSAYVERRFVILCDFVSEILYLKNFKIKHCRLLLLLLLLLLLF